MYRAHRFDSVGVVSIRIANFFMAFREGQPTGWLGARPQGLPEERAHAPQMPMRSRAPVGSYPEPDVEEVGPNNPSGIWHSAQVANFMKTVLLYVFMHTNAAVASGIQSLMKERRDLRDRVESGLLPGEQWMDWQGNKFSNWHTGPKETSADCWGEHLDNGPPPPYASSTPPPSSYAGQGSATRIEWVGYKGFVDLRGTGGKGWACGCE